MNASQAKGAVFEEIVLHLLEQIGYRVVAAPDEGTRNGHSGLEVQGRGEWHQVDALVAHDHTPAFMYPLRLVVEAKCYRIGQPITLIVPRNLLGVLHDVSQNYFSFHTSAGEEIQVPRFNYHGAVFSTSGYTVGAQRFAIAHQIFLIQYENVRLMQPIRDWLLTFEERFSEVPAPERSLTQLRQVIRTALLGTVPPNTWWTEQAELERLLRAVNGIHGSYFGMLQGKYPMHLVSRGVIPPDLVAQSDDIACRVFRRPPDWQWVFAPSDPAYLEAFELEFDLPDQIRQLVKEGLTAAQLAGIKRREFSFLDLTGHIGGVRRNLRLSLDNDWLDRVLEQRGTGA